MKTIFKTTMLVALGILLFGCSKSSEIDEVRNQQIVDYTEWDVNTNFKTFDTYAIVDSATVIIAGQSEKIKGEEVDNVISRVITNMNDRGYTKVDHLANPKPDLGINITVIEKIDIYYTYPGWYWGYGGYYGGGYWGYPGYDYYYSYYPQLSASYESGTLLIEIYDLKHANPDNNKINVVWSGYIRSVLLQNYPTSTVNQHIDQCFTQSPVLHN